MANTNDFIHLPLPLKYTGKPKLRSGGSPDSRTAENRANRTTHGAEIKRRAGELSRFWSDQRVVCMIFAQVAGANSLRDIIGGLADKT